MVCSPLTLALSPQGRGDSGGYFLTNPPWPGVPPSNHENDFPPHPIPLPPGEREIYRGINLNPLPLDGGG